MWNHDLSVRRLVAALVVSVMVAGSGFADGAADETFEDDALGFFPSCPWSDVGLVDPTEPNPPDPSAEVVETTDAFGSPTQALSFVDALAPSSGVYLPVPISAHYVVTADVRVDQFCDAPGGPASDWAVDVGLTQLLDIDFANSPNVGIYASAQTQGWRLYAFGTADAGQDIDLELPVKLGTWYRLQVELAAATGVVVTRIWDIATDTLLHEQTHTIKDWTPADGAFDIVSAFDGELTKENTISNLAVVDNITYELCAEKDDGLLGDLDGDGDVDSADLALLLGNWTG